MSHRELKHGFVVLRSAPSMGSILLGLGGGGRAGSCAQALSGDGGLLCDVAAIDEMSIRIQVEITLPSVTEENQLFLAWMHMYRCQPMTKGSRVTSFTRNSRAEQTTLKGGIDDFRRIGGFGSKRGETRKEQVAMEKQDHWTRCAVDDSGQ